MIEKKKTAKLPSMEDLIRLGCLLKGVAGPSVNTAPLVSIASLRTIRSGVAHSKLQMILYVRSCLTGNDRFEHVPDRVTEYR